ncbi:MAG: aldehyde dehydrogenase family protein [Burkholderiales bacterium]|nr:aldehyde dehydrogenase family protein [Burkholderiales bacterium]
MSLELFERHRALLDLALAATVTRSGFTARAEESTDSEAVLEAEGREAFANYCGSYFYLDQPGVGERIGEERSPYGSSLEIQYPKTNLGTVLPAAARAREAWRRFTLRERAGICLEILQQLHLRSHEIGLATMHTTGAPQALAMRQGGILAQDRALEALAMAYQELRGVPSSDDAAGSRTQGELGLTRRWRQEGLGIGLVIGCSTQPNLRAYPGIFANLMTGNAVVVKPHPQAVLPLAITVGVARHVVREAGGDPNLVTLVVDEAQSPIAQSIALRPEVRIVDYAGNGDFAAWLIENARHARCHVFGGAVNAVIVDGTANIAETIASIVRSACEYAGRMCTSPRVILVPRDGVSTPNGIVDRDRFAELLALEFGRTLSDDLAAARLLGAMRLDEYGTLVQGASALGEVLVESRVIDHPEFPGAQVYSPAVVRVKPEERSIWMREWFGPISFLAECESTADAISMAAAAARSQGALNAMLFTLDAGVRVAAEEALGAVGVALCVNFGRQQSVNDELPFCDYHGPGINPAGNATVCHSAFVAGRFRVVGDRFFR